MAFSSVWIEEGCTACDACADACPEVFKVDHDEGTAVVIADARVDGKTSTNEAEKAALKGDLGSAQEESIQDAADGCPVGIIQMAK
ncbi:MAG: ferredoxin [Planctomycetota bacterium]|nr:ferredoxin [Planctomycetota bacterium]